MGSLSSLGLSEVSKAGNTLECDGFSVRVGRGYPAMFIEVKDFATEQTFRKREKSQTSSGLFTKSLTAMWRSSASTATSYTRPSRSGPLTHQFH